MSRKVVICGAGFLGSNIAKAIICAPYVQGKSVRRVQLSSRRPDKVYNAVRQDLDPSQVQDRLLPPIAADITDASTLTNAFKDANVVVSLVGLMYGKPMDFDRVQWHGAENVATAANAAGAKLIHISAIGADPTSTIPYERTKGLGERAVLESCPTATIIRPSIVFGPGDDFFTRFAKMSGFMPVMPVFGGGWNLFQPVYVGDIARAVEVISRDDPEIRKLVDGKIIEAGGPDVMSFREVIQAVLHTKKRWRPIVSLPYFVGQVQAQIFERLPQNGLTITRDQLKMLKKDNIVNKEASPNTVSFKNLLENYSDSGTTCVHDVLSKYL